MLISRRTEGNIDVDDVLQQTVGREYLFLEIALIVARSASIPSVDCLRDWPLRRASHSTKDSLCST